MLVTFFYANVGGLPECRESYDRGQRKKTELAMIHKAEGLQKLTKKTHRRRLSDVAESDSIDSLICACGSSMLMRFSHAHDVLPCSRGFLCGERDEGVLRQDDDSRKMAYIKGGIPRNGTSREGGNGEQTRRRRSRSRS